jgi:hypothetical protein
MLFSLEFRVSNKITVTKEHAKNENLQTQKLVSEASRKQSRKSYDVS